MSATLIISVAAVVIFFVGLLWFAQRSQRQNDSNDHSD